MRLPSTVSSGARLIFPVGLACALAAVALVSTSGCMTDAARTAIQGAMSDVNSVKGTMATTPPIGGAGNHDPEEWGPGK